MNYKDLTIREREVVWDKVKTCQRELAELGVTGNYQLALAWSIAMAGYGSVRQALESDFIPAPQRNLGKIGIAWFCDHKRTPEQRLIAFSQSLVDEQMEINPL